jgi:hypothetical protein
MHTRRGGQAIKGQAPEQHLALVGPGQLPQRTQLPAKAAHISRRRGRHPKRLADERCMSLMSRSMDLPKLKLGG